MAKNPRRQLTAVPAAPVSRISFPSSAKKWLLAGLFSVVVGFVLLCWTDPSGQNWASTLSPFLLVGGYVLLGVGFYQADSTATPS